MEHHANVVPWHMLAAERGVELRWIPLTADYRLDLTDLDALLDGAKLLAISAMSNVLGTINDDPAARRRRARAPARSCSSTPASPCRTSPTDVQAWDADFVAFSAHKMLGPSGIGALWARRELLEAMPPFLGGGEMIRDVRARRLHHQRGAVEVRGRHPARSPRRSASGAAVDYLEALGMDAVRDARDASSPRYALDALRDRFGDRPHDLRPADTDDARRRDLVPLRRASTRTTSARCSTRTACACAPGTTAPSR